MYFGLCENRGCAEPDGLLSTRICVVPPNARLRKSIISVWLQIPEFCDRTHGQTRDRRLEDAFWNPQDSLPQGAADTTYTFDEFISHLGAAFVGEIVHLEPGLSSVSDGERAWIGTKTSR